MTGRLTVEPINYGDPKFIIEIKTDNKPVVFSIDGLGQFSVEVRRPEGKGPKFVELATKFPNDEEMVIRPATTHNPPGGIRYYGAYRDEQIGNFRVHVNTDERMVTNE